MNKCREVIINKASTDTFSETANRIILTKLTCKIVFGYCYINMFKVIYIFVIGLQFCFVVLLLNSIKK